MTDTTMSFIAQLSFVCTGRSKKTTSQISVSPPPKTVADLKLAIQSKFQIPKCLQLISIGSDETSLPDLQLIDNLYIRSGDNFTVTYLDEAEVHTIRKLIESLSPFVEKLSIRCENNKDVGSFIKENTNNVNRLCYMYNVIASGNYLMPWNGLTKIEANRQFLTQEKVIDNSLKLYSLLLDNLMEKTLELTTDLVVSCLGLLWNFAETREARLYVIKRGGFGLFLHSLKHCSHHNNSDDQPYDMYGLFDRVVGCISNYSEIPQCQVSLASNKQGMHAFLDFCLEGPSLNVFTKLLIANCLFRLSHNTLTHQFLLEADLLDKIILFFEKYKGNIAYKTSMVICYALVVTICRLLSFLPSHFPPHLITGALSALQVFLSSVQTEKMTAALEEYQCNWITLAPFVDVFFAPIHCDQSFGVVDVRLICMKVNLKVLTVEMSRSCHRKLAVKQGLLDSLICLQWTMDRECQDAIRAVVQLFKKDVEPHCLPPPQLHTLAAVSLAKYGQFSIRNIFNF